MTRTCNERPLAYETKHKIFAKREKKKNQKNNSGRKPSNEVHVCGPKSGETGRPSIKRSGIDHSEPVFDVIDRMYAAQLSANESEETIDALRPQVKIAVQELIRQQGKPANFTGILDYHGFHIRVQRPTSYTWEQNTNPTVTSDPNHSIYVQQLDLQRRMNDQLKDMRADLKRTAEKLANAHPSSESIKRDFTIALMK